MGTVFGALGSRFSFARIGMLFYQKMFCFINMTSQRLIATLNAKLICCLGKDVRVNSTANATRRK